MSKQQIAANKASASKGSKNTIPYLIIGLFAFVLYAQTLTYDYTLDDSIVITRNEFTKQGIQGIPDLLAYDTFTGFFGKQKNLVAGGRYRPLSLITFAIEYQLFGLNPGFSHFINILLYALTGILLYKILLLLLPIIAARSWYQSLPFVAVMLFMAHPVHTEVVANIKGRDEIMTLLGSLLAMYFTLRYLNNKNYKYLIYSFLAFFLGLMAKENTITFLAVIPLSVYFFTNHNLKDNLFSALPLVAASVLFLIIRQSVLGDFSAPVARELLNNPFLDASNSEKFATIFYTLGLYIQLLIFPHPLTYDYYPKEIPIIGWGDIRAWGSLLIYAVLGLIALLHFRKKTILSFSIFFFIATLSVVSNLVFPVGTFMNERFIYISSIAFGLIIAWILVEKLPTWIKNVQKYQQTFLSILGIILLLYSLKTWARNPAWENDFTLFSTDVQTSVNSAKGNAAAAAKYRELAEQTDVMPNVKKESYEKAIQYWTRALEIHPAYFDVALDLGITHFRYNKNIDQTMHYFRQAFLINSDNSKVYQFCSAVFNELKNPQKKLEFYLSLNQLKPDKYSVLYEIGITYGKELNQLETAIIYLEKAVSVNPRGTEAYKDLGVAWGFKGNPAESIKYSLKAYELNPKDAQTCFNLGVNYRQIGDTVSAKKYFDQAAQLDPNYKTTQ
jgi:protein O-mannosyl-transferase